MLHLGHERCDGAIHFRDDIYGHDEKRELVAELRPSVATASRATGFILQSADPKPTELKPVSYLDSQ